MKYSQGMVVLVAVMGIAGAGWAQVSSSGSASGSSVNWAPVEPTPAPVQNANKPVVSENQGGLRFGIRSNPGVDEMELELLGQSESLTIVEDNGMQVDLTYVKRFMGKDGKSTFGGLAGLGAFYASSSGGDATGTVDVSAGGLLVQLGMAVRPLDFLVLELGGDVGLGMGSQDVDVADFTPDSGFYYSYSLKAGAYFLIGNHFELGLEAGYMGFTSQGSIDLIVEEMDVTFTGSGVQGGAVLVYKF